MNIKEASEYLHISKETLRYWETIGLIPSVPRNHSGYREYTGKELKWALFIKSMRNAGMSVDSLVQFVKLYRSPRDTRAEQKELIHQQYESLLQQRETLDETIRYLKYKLDHFEDHILPFLQDKSYFTKHQAPIIKGEKHERRHKF